MSTSTQLHQIMATPLPGLTKQKKRAYRTNYEEVITIYNVLNDAVFNNELKVPEIQIMSRCRNYWGYCYSTDWPCPHKIESKCKIRLSDKWYCIQWLTTMLAHEMCHQYQWDIDSHTRKHKGLGPIITHGPSFFIFKPKLAEFKIPLSRVGHSTRNWWVNQDIFKC